jgi:hypothetical protein
MSQKDDSDTTTLAANRLAPLASWPEFFKGKSDDCARIGSKPSCEITILGGGLTSYNDYYDQ